MNFKEWLLNETIDLIKPKKTTKRSVIKNKGTNTAKEIIEYQFTTPIGNDVKVHFIPQDKDSYEIQFYVNDKMYDNATEKENSIRDPHVLSGVLYIMKNKAKQLKAQELSLTARTGAGDYKTVRNIPTEPRIAKALTIINDFILKLSSYPVQMIPPSESTIELAKKFKKPNLLEPKPDLEIKRYLPLAIKIKNDLENNPNNLIAQLMSQENAATTLIDNLLIPRNDMQKLNVDGKEIVDSIKDVQNALKSQQESGWLRNINRREKIYERLINQHFTDEWNIKKTGTTFRLTKKENPITENTIPLNIDNLHITKTKAGDGINYTIHDNEKIIGHISGFEQEFGPFENMFHLYKTELNKETRNDPKYQNKNIYRTAIQKVANLYKNGLFVNKYEASSLLRDSLKKMDTYELVNDEVITIKPKH